MTVDNFLIELGKNGPWAMMAGFLLWQIIKAWTDDRKTLTVVLTEFKSTMDGLRTSVDKLADRLEDIENEYRELRK